MVMPSLQPARESVIKYARTETSNVRMVKSKPFECTVTYVSSNDIVPSSTMFITDLMSHGKPRQTRMSKMFEPNRLHNAMFAKPRFTTKTLEITSGIEEPAAKIVKPTTVCGKRKVKPMRKKINN